MKYLILLLTFFLFHKGVATEMVSMEKNDIDSIAISFNPLYIKEKTDTSLFVDYPDIKMNIMRYSYEDDEDGFKRHEFGIKVLITGSEFLKRRDKWKKDKLCIHDYFVDFMSKHKFPYNYMWRNILVSYVILFKEDGDNGFIACQDDGNNELLIYYSISNDNISLKLESELVFE